jgi:hypothetical protein
LARICFQRIGSLDVLDDLRNEGGGNARDAVKREFVGEVSELV